MEGEVGDALRPGRSQQPEVVRSVDRPGDGRRQRPDREAKELSTGTDGVLGSEDAGGEKRRRPKGSQGRSNRMQRADGDAGFTCGEPGPDPATEQRDRDAGRDAQAVPRTGHTLTSEEPEKFNAALDEFFAEAERGRWLAHKPK